MNSVIEAIVGALALLTLGAALGPIYKAVKTETVIKVHQGLHNSLEPFTQKLTRQKLRH